MVQRRWIWLLFAVFIIGFPVAALLQQRPPALDDLGPAPEFSLVDQRGEQLDSSSLEGTVLVIDFIFTRCPDVCPLLSEKMAALQKDLEDSKGKPVGFLSISVDPEFDTPEVLAEYGARYDADPQKWQLLTGERASIDAIISGFMAALVRQAGDEEVPNITHSQRFVLVDSEGTIRGHYPTDATGLEELERAIRHLQRS